MGEGGGEMDPPLPPASELWLVLTSFFVVAGWGGYLESPTLSLLVSSSSLDTRTTTTVSFLFLSRSLPHSPSLPSFLPLLPT